LVILASYPETKNVNPFVTAEICLKCGACCNVNYCCHVMYDPQFDPKYTFVYDCLGSKNESSNPNIWLCVSCHKCEEVCPYEVSPISYIEALKYDALRNGLIHELIKLELKQIMSTGYAFQITRTTENLRTELNLKSIDARGISELLLINEKTGLLQKLEKASS